MRRASLKAGNGWQRYLSSGRFAGECSRICGELSWMLGEGRSVAWTVRGTAAGGQVISAVAGGRHAVTVRAGDRFTAVALASPLLATTIVRKLTRSERLVLSAHFQRAALEVLALGAAAAAGAEDIRVIPGLPMAGSCPPFSEERLVHVVVQLRGCLPEGDADLFIRGEPPVPNPWESSERGPALDASIFMEARPLTLESAWKTMPGDTINLGPEEGRFFLSIGGGISSHFVEFPLEKIDQGGRCGFAISGGPEEVFVEESKTVEAAGPAGCVSLGRLRLPARIEMFTVSIPVSELGGLAPGQIVDVGDTGSRRARMYVCGELFAEGRLERFEDFHGFRVEKVF